MAYIQWTTIPSHITHWHVHSHWLFSPVARYTYTRLKQTPSDSWHKRSVCFTWLDQVLIVCVLLLWFTLFWRFVCFLVFTLLIMLLIYCRLHIAWPFACPWLCLWATFWICLPELLKKNNTNLHLHLHLFPNSPKLYLGQCFGWRF